MEDRRLITVAIHTYDKAMALKAILEHEGIEVTLQNVNLTSPIISSGVRVRIAEDNLPLALRIIENPEIFTLVPDSEATSTCSSNANVVLLPVDFSDRSFHAAKIAFAIAARSKDRVVFLHSYLVPRSNALISLSNSLTFDSGAIQAEEVESSVEIARVAHEKMSSLLARVKTGIKSGEIPAAKFSSVLREGVPEERIGEYVKENPSVRLIVMGTRAAERKAHDLAGSITAEVLDSTRIQALTVPECDSAFTSMESIRSVVLLSSLEQEDFLALDALYRLMPPSAELDVKVVCMPNEKYSKSTVDAARTALREYCKEHFPNYRFSLSAPDVKLEAVASDNVDLIVVPNRKKNIFARLFNPGLAHRILFHSDIPMMVIPV